jgi:cytidyltransferase-like protein
MVASANIVGDKKRIIYLTGSFDILHSGHLNVFEFCNSFKCDIVKILIDSDSRIKERKGDDRPYNNLEDRIRMLKALKCSETFDIIPIDTEERMLSVFRMARNMGTNNIFMIRVLGSDYIGKEIVGKDFFDIIAYVDRDQNSTTKLINKINKLSE